jgi:hypothetical protein
MHANMNAYKDLYVDVCMFVRRMVYSLNKFLMK